MTALVELSESLKTGFGYITGLGRHDLQHRPLFRDEALIDLLDRMPREHLYAFHMGRDPARVDENRLAKHEGVSGAELLKAVSRGRLWLNVTQVDRVEPE